jgi:acetoin utilization deacetylase AcuC-like enzyme
MKIFYSETHHQHHPPFEIFDGGVRVPNFEVPERAERILAALQHTNWAEIHSPDDFGLEPILGVHDAEYIDFLRSAYAEWLTVEADAQYPKEALLPATFPSGIWKHKPRTLLGRAGYYMSDLSAPIAAGTYPAALSAANCALSGARAVLGGDKTAFALSRPPGHHAGKANCAGYCYINNAAVAANWCSTKRKTALLDIDYHCGNGTQDIFYERSDVLTISIHADPDYEYPYFNGYANETGTGVGAGFHHNFPLPAGTEDKNYLSTLDQALDVVKNFEAQVLILSTGLDLFKGDPLGKFSITREGIQQIGQKIANLGLPCLVVMEGGYNNSALGENIVALLEPFR